MRSLRSGREGAVVVGAGPNGLSAAIELARAGVPVELFEGAAEVGGGARCAALTLPGFVHDVCSAVHPLAAASPFFKSLPLREHGLEWIEPPAALAHPLDDGRCAVLERSIAATGETLGRDATSYRALVEPFVERFESLLPALLAPIHLPRRPLVLARFGLQALRSARGLALRRFREEPARALFAGIAAHSALEGSRAATASFGLVLALAAHAVGWPMPRGGSQQLSNALAACLRSLGGRIETGVTIRSLAELPSSRTILLDLTPRQVLDVVGERLPRGYARALRRFRYGCGVFKLDWALSGPVPWRAAGCRRAVVVHVVGALEELLAAEGAVARGEHSQRPFVLVVQPSLFDRSRAPPGMHTLWAYCHVPNGSSVDMTERIEAQIERFAPGFRTLILARHAMRTAELEAHDPNLVGGDVGGGENSLRQLLFRPVLRRVPYSTPLEGLFLCSASTPPGGGVHGMCGFHAARAALEG